MMSSLASPRRDCVSEKAIDVIAELVLEPISVERHEVRMVHF